MLIDCLQLKQLELGLLNEFFLLFDAEEDDYDGSGKLYNITKQLYNENKRWFNKRNITL